MARINRGHDVVLETERELREQVERHIGVAVPADLWRSFWQNAAALGLATSPPYDGYDLDLATQWLRGHGAARASYIERARAEVQGRLAFADVEGRIDAARTELSGRRSPRFRSSGAAERWLRKTAESDGGTRVVAYTERPGDAPRPPRRASVSAKQLRKRSLDRLSLLVAEGLYVAYLRPDGSTGRQPARLGGTLDTLRLAATPLARDIGCREEDMVSYILTGEPIFIPPVRVWRSERLGARPAMRMFSLSVQFSWVPASLVSQVYATVRREGLTPIDWQEQLVRFVDEVEGPTADKLAAWNRRFPERQYKNEKLLQGNRLSSA